MRPWTRAAGVVVGVLLVTAFLLATPTPVRAEEDLLGKTGYRNGSSIALALARKKHERAFRDLVEILRSLGAPADELGKLEAKGTEQLSRAKKRRDAKAEHRKLMALTERLAAGLDALPPDRRTYLAGVLITLDADQAAARAALSHVRHGGRWTPQALVPLLERRAQIEELVKRHRKARYEVELGVSEEPSFVAAYGKRGAVARHETIEVHVARTGEAGARRILLQALRGWSLAAALSGISPDLLPKDPVRVAFHGTHAEYLRSIQHAVAAGRLPAADAAQARDHRTYRTKDGYLVTGSGIEAHHQTFVLFDIWITHVRRGLGDKEPLPCLEAGFLNWIMLQIMGCPLPRITWRETEYEKRLGSTLDPAENVRRKELFRMARAGLAGTRAYLRFLMARRLDPPWRNAFQDELGKVRGHDLLKCTIVCEYLLETELFWKVLRSTVDVDRKSADATSTGLEKATGRPMDRFEQDVRTWMLHRDGPGLLQRLSAGAAPPDANSGPSPLPYLTAIRARAFRRSNPVSLEPDLTAGATAHARYLARHPKQAASWPEAHEEYVDHELYSPAGARAAASSVIAPGSSSWKGAIDAWMGTFFHRLPLIDPGLLGIGAGLEAGMAVLDTGSLVDEWGTRAYVAWPPKGEMGVPLRFAPEMPNPVPGVSQSTMGYPITLQIFADSGQPKMTMELLAGGVPVPCHYSAPHAPLNPELVPAGAYCLIPKAPLAPRTLYTVKIGNIEQEANDGSRKTHSMTWTFRTGG